MLVHQAGPTGSDRADMICQLYVNIFRTLFMRGTRRGGQRLKAVKTTTKTRPDDTHTLDLNWLKRTVVVVRFRLLDYLNGNPIAITADSYEQ